MQIEKDAVVSIDYTLKDEDGRVIDSSEGGEPLAYLHGGGNIIPGLEKELEGKAAGDELQVAIPAEEGYGQRNEQLVQEVAREQFGQIDELVPGMQFQVQSEAGPLVVTVTDVGEEKVVIDGNHPLAGIDLHFGVTVREVREATDEEKEHGHAHGPDSHQE
jgi:FKBP-type peptidyl-prolyl cis-trans isomerase SlyD